MSSSPASSASGARALVPIAALVGAAFLFGVTFVVVKEAVAVMPPLGFVGWRFLLGAGALLMLGVPRGRQVWVDGAVAGGLLFAGYGLQTAGLVTTAASNSALITGLYVVLTPVLAAVWGRRLPGPWVVAGTVAGFAGLGLLTIEPGLRLGRGDLLTVGCAFGFAAHIVALSRTASRHRVVPFTAVQLLVTAALALVSSAVFEAGSLPTGEVWPALVLTGIAVSAGAFLLQVWAQREVGADRTAVVLALEPVFGSAGAALVLGERLDRRGWIGAGLILVAIYIVVWATGRRRPELQEAEAISQAH